MEERYKPSNCLSPRVDRKAKDVQEDILRSVHAGEDEGVEGARAGVLCGLGLSVQCLSNACLCCLGKPQHQLDPTRSSGSGNYVTR